MATAVAARAAAEERAHEEAVARAAAEEQAREAVARAAAEGRTHEESSSGGKRQNSEHGAFSMSDMRAQVTELAAALACEKEKTLQAESRAEFAEDWRPDMLEYEVEKRLEYELERALRQIGSFYREPAWLDEELAKDRQEMPGVCLYPADAEAPRQEEAGPPYLAGVVAVTGAGN